MNTFFFCNIWVFFFFQNKPIFHLQFSLHNVKVNGNSPIIYLTTRQYEKKIENITVDLVCGEYLREVKNWKASCKGMCCIHNSSLMCTNRDVSRHTATFFISQWVKYDLDKKKKIFPFSVLK